ncbi:MAG: peptide chain release factor N(5)-glutamine methyltransferase [Candidatus Moranbacteria bacterium]|nr:peptide chain release factor N(5)-glutamine methyltransferase [Candidatus Moranbacteria bacterium]
MKTIKDFCINYYKKIDFLDLELIIASVLKKPREFVLAHPDYKISATHNSRLKTLIKRRRRHEPLAYILGRKEFYSLDFKVNKNVLIPRPETELLVDLVLKELKKNKLQVAGYGLQNIIIDVGTGSGNIIISLAYNMKHGTYNNINFYGTDISQKALLVAKYNAKKHKVDKHIYFFKSDLLKNKKLINNLTMQQCNNLIVLANLPYLSKEIYSPALKSVRKYEPKSALFSPQNGLGYYAKLLKQLNKLKNECSMLHVTCFMEISHEQKLKISKLIKSCFPASKIKFHKDLASKWRVCEVII